MPKTIDTRKQQAAELVRVLEQGPAFYKSFQSGSIFTPEQAKEQYDTWLRSWVLPPVKRLIPELRLKEPTE